MLPRASSDESLQDSRLLQAAIDGDDLLVDTLLSEPRGGPSRNAKSKALGRACFRGNSAMASRLLQAGADATYEDEMENTPLMLALLSDSPGSHPTVFAILGCMAQQPEAPAKLFRASLSNHNRTGETALSIACRRRDAGVIQVVRALLSEGACVNSKAIAAALDANSHAVAVLVTSFLNRRHDLLSKMRVQRILDLLEPTSGLAPHKGVRPVCAELLIEIQTFSTYWLIKACVRGFRDDPYETFSDAIVLATAFLREARAVHNDRLRADVLVQQAGRVQHVMCGILRSLSYTAMGSQGYSCLHEFLASERAMRTIRLAVRAECKVLLALPEVQEHMRWRWRGGIKQGEQLGSLSMGSRTRVCWTPAALLAATAYPPLDGAPLTVTECGTPSVHHGACCGVWEHLCAAAPSPWAKFGLSALNDIALSATLIVDKSPLLLAWAGCCLISEIGMVLVAVLQDVVDREAEARLRQLNKPELLLAHRHTTTDLEQARDDVLAHRATAVACHRVLLPTITHGYIQLPTTPNCYPLSHAVTRRRSHTVTCRYIPASSRTRRAARTRTYFAPLRVTLASRWRWQQPALEPTSATQPTPHAVPM